MVFLNTGISGLDDDRVGADQRARTWNMAIGASVQWTQKTSLGITGGYSHGKITSKANAATMTGDYYSIALSASHKLMKNLNLGVSANYAHGENTLAIGGGVGSFGVDIFAASASLSSSFERAGITISPSLSAGISNVMRDAYTDSNAIFVPSSDKTHGNIEFGVNFSKSITNVDGFRSFTPSIGISSGYTFRENLDAALTSGAISKELGLGATLTGGLAFNMDNGVSANIGGSYGLFQNDVQAWSLNAGLSVKF